MHLIGVHTSILLLETAVGPVLQTKTCQAVTVHPLSSKSALILYNNVSINVLSYWANLRNMAK